MRHIHINSGRLVQRYVGEGDYLLGLIHLDPNEKIREGVDYLLSLDNQQSFLLELPPEHQQSLSSELQNSSLDDILCSQTWRQTTEDNVRIVRLIRQFDDSNGWLVFGPKIDKKVSADKWVDVVHSYVFPIPEPISTQGEKAMGLARKPIWPHPNGQLYTMVPNFPVLRKVLAGATQMKILAREHYGFANILKSNRGDIKAIHCHPFWDKHFSSMDMEDYGLYLQTMNTMGLIGEEQPMSLQQHVEYEKLSRQAVEALVKQMGSPTRPHLSPLTTEQRTTILNTSVDRVECTNAVFESVLVNDTSVIDTPAWNNLSIDHVLICAASALNNNNSTLVEKIAQTIAYSDCWFKDEAFLQLAREANHIRNSVARNILVQHHTPNCLTQDWEMIAYDIIPIDPRALEHWVAVYDGVMFENVLGYTLNNQEANLSWDEKCVFIGKIVAQGSPWKWNQNAVFERASYVNPVPSFEQWDMLFSTLDVKPVAQKGLMGESQKSFEMYFEHICALDQKQRLNTAVEDQNEPKKLNRKKI